MSMIANIRNYMITCPVLDQLAPINVDMVGVEPTNYSISPIPTDPIVSEFITGKSIRKYDFAFMARNLTSETAEMIENQDVFEQFSKWLEEQTDIKNFPDVETNQEAMEIKAIAGAFLQSMDADSAIYSIQCQFIYRQEGA